MKQVNMRPRLKACVKSLFVCNSLAFGALMLVASRQPVEEHPGLHQAPLSSIHRVRVIPQGGEESLGAPPWAAEIANRTVFDRESDIIHAGHRYILANLSYSSGLGNILFQYAAYRAIQLDHDAELLVELTNTSFGLLRAFRVDQSTNHSMHLITPALALRLRAAWPVRSLVDCCRFYGDLVSNLSLTPGVAFRAYFQSFRYFHPQHEQVIRADLDWHAGITQRARDYIQRHQLLLDESDSTRICMHVRRGIDLTWNLRNVQHGHTVAPLRYYLRALQHATISANASNHRVFVISDDAAWCRREFAANVNVTTTHVVQSGYREVDLAIVGQLRCSSFVLSTGTFGWWAAYLSRAPRVVYYARWPRPASPMDRMLNRTDYFPADWVALQ